MVPAHAVGPARYRRRSGAGVCGEGSGMTQRVVRVGPVELAVETFGAPGDPPLLLISGAASSMDWWEPEFCERLAAGGRYVVRYDHRDTGASTAYPPGEPGYGGPELRADALAILDDLGIEQAQVVGISAGGAVAQRLTLDAPTRVSSLVLISTSPAVPGGPDRAQLPPTEAELAASFEIPNPDPDWTDREAVIAHVVAGEHAFAGSAGVDESSVRAVAGRVFDRSPHLASAANHWILDDDETERRLAEITAPTLVLHGTDDPLFPLGHGEALVREIPGARLISLPGIGHQMPPRSTWDVVVPAILAGL